jgi:hypothetical protein
MLLEELQTSPHHEDATIGHGDLLASGIDSGDGDHFPCSSSYIAVQRSPEAEAAGEKLL